MSHFYTRSGLKIRLNEEKLDPLTFMFVCKSTETCFVLLSLINAIYFLFMTINTTTDGFFNLDLAVRASGVAILAKQLFVHFKPGILIKVFSFFMPLIGFLPSICYIVGAIMFAIKGMWMYLLWTVVVMILQNFVSAVVKRIIMTVRGFTMSCQDTEYYATICVASWLELKEPLSDIYYDLI